MQRCQSCGMPMDQDPEHRTGEYCSYCERDGKFVDSFTKPEEMQAFVRQKLREHGMGRFKSWLLSLDIPRLKRWRKR